MGGESDEEKEWCEEEECEDGAFHRWVNDSMEDFENSSKCVILFAPHLEEHCVGTQAVNEGRL